MIALAILLAGSYLPHPEKALGAGGQNTFIDKFTDSTEVLASTTASTLLLATSTSRQYAIIGNNSASSTIYLSLTGGGAAVVNKGVMLVAGASYEIKDSNLYTGAIYVITKTNIASTTVAAKQ